MSDERTTDELTTRELQRAWEVARQESDNLREQPGAAFEAATTRETEAFERYTHALNLEKSSGEPPEAVRA
jgi:hypothetical protein